MLIIAGIQQVIYLDGYPDNLSLDMLRESGITVEVFRESDRKVAGGSA